MPRMSPGQRRRHLDKSGAFSSSSYTKYSNNKKGETMRLFVAGALALSGGIALAVVSPGHGAPADGVLRLKVVDSFPPGHYIGTSLPKFFMDRVTQLTNGKVQFDYY